MFKKKIKLPLIFNKIETQDFVEFSESNKSIMIDRLSITDYQSEKVNIIKYRKIVSKIMFYEEL
jgi:hypothetical protein